MNNFNKIFLQFFIAGLALLCAGAAAAFTGPLSAPPACTSGNPGCDAPLNVSGNAQAKAGGLLLNTGGAQNGLIVQKGNVGIGTGSPAGKLDIEGGNLCLNGACINTWPSSTSGGAKPVRTVIVSATGSWNVSAEATCNANEYLVLGGGGCNNATAVSIPLIGGDSIPYGWHNQCITIFNNATPFVVTAYAYCALR